MLFLDAIICRYVSLLVNQFYYLSEFRYSQCYPKSKIRVPAVQNATCTFVCMTCEDPTLNYKVIASLESTGIGHGSDVSRSVWRSVNVVFQAPSKLRTVRSKECTVCNVWWEQIKSHSTWSDDDAKLLTRREDRLKRTRRIFFTFFPSLSITDLLTPSKEKSWESVENYQKVTIPQYY
jgi:hypothetical protein